MSIYRVRRWRTPATSYPLVRHGAAEIKRIWYDQGIYHMYYVPTSDGTEHQYYEVVNQIPITTLEINGEVWMVDDVPHHFAMLHHASHYQGHVLVAGLGLGLIVHALNARPQVESITVVERCQDVIGLIGPLLPHGKLKIIEGDWYDYKHQGPVDGVLFDLFVGNGFTLLRKAVDVLLDARERYPSAGPVRIHGMNQSLVQRMADAICMVRDQLAWTLHGPQELLERLRSAQKPPEGR